MKSLKEEVDAGAEADTEVDQFQLLHIQKAGVGGGAGLSGEGAQL